MFVEGTGARTGRQADPGAWIDTWHADDGGYYDVQNDASGATLDMRARLHTGGDGRFWYRSVVPAYYPIPNDGPVGKMLDAQGRHPYRPAHVHFMIGAPGCETMVTHVFLGGDKYLDSDVVFGVKDSLICALESLPPGVTPDGHEIAEPVKLLHYDFVLAPAKAVV